MNVRRGDIRNAKYAYKALQFNYGLMSQLFPGKISPTDIDGLVEINSSFWFQENKTIGQTLPLGQQILFERFFKKLRGSMFLTIGSHKSLQSVTIPDEISTFSFWFWKNGGVYKSSEIINENGELEWWADQFAKHSTGKLNDFTRVLLELSGTFPPSRTNAHAFPNKVKFDFFHEKDLR